MNLLSDEAILAAYAAFGDLADTFYRDTVTVVRRRRAASLFNDSRAASTTSIPTDVPGMNVPDKRPVEEQQRGTSDRTGGYVLCDGTQLRTAGLADERGLVLVDEGTDEIRINGGPLLRLDKVVPLGPLGGRMAVAKFYYRQELPANT